LTAEDIRWIPGNHAPLFLKKQGGLLPIFPLLCEKMARRFLEFPFKTRLDLL